MQETAVSTLNAWDSFYVIIGSSSAALTGLMFVVVTLMPEARKRMAATEDALSAFATPTIIHFCAALLVSAILSAPWGDLHKPGIAVALCGVAGLVYSMIVLRRVQHSTDYRPVFVDWLWHVILAFLAYVTLVFAGFELRDDRTSPMFAVGAATLLLLFIGIHNAWDSVTFITFGLEPEQAKDTKPKDKPKPGK